MINRRIRSFIPWIPSILWMAAIFYFASRPTPFPNANGGIASTTSTDSITQQPAKINIPWDMLAHAGEFAGLYFWLYLGFSSRNFSSFAEKSPKMWKRFGIIFVISSLYALSDEVHQIFVIGRGFEFGDLIVDVFGIICAMLILIVWRDFCGKPRSSF